jgi:hypothetical protein
MQRDRRLWIMIPKGDGALMVSIALISVPVLAVRLKCAAAWRRYISADNPVKASADVAL